MSSPPDTHPIRKPRFPPSGAFARSGPAHARADRGRWPPRKPRARIFLRARQRPACALCIALHGLVAVTGSLRARLRSQRAVPIFLCLALFSENERSPQFFGHANVNNWKTKGHAGVTPRGLQRDCPPRPSRDSASRRIMCAQACLSSPPANYPQFGRACSRRRIG